MQDLIEEMKCKNCKNCLIENGKYVCSKRTSGISVFDRTGKRIGEEYLPVQLNDTCGFFEKSNSPIKEEKDFSNLKYKVLQMLALKEKREATEEIVRYIISNNHIYTTKDDQKSEMWIYKEGVYVPHGKSEIKQIVRDILEEAYTTHFLNEVISKVEADTFIEQNAFFKTNIVDEVPVQNGVLNILTGQLSDFNPKKIFFSKLPIKYDPSKKCPNILEHFKNVLKSEDDVPVMLELFGYLLYKENKIEQAFMFVGNGRNGKSKTLELMRKFVGVENCASIPLCSMNESSFDVWELFGKMVNLAGDLSKTDLKETGMFKTLIGRDEISARRKFLNVLKFVNHAKLVFAANDLPRVYDTSHGFWSKWIVLEFPYQFVTKDVYASSEDKSMKKIMNPDIIEQITTPDEMSGLLNEALKALQTLLANKKFSYSKGTADIKDFWIRKSDSFMAFCMDCLEEDFDAIMPKHVLRKLYSSYCKHFKVKGTSDKSIKVTLEEEYGATEKRIWIDGEFDYCWEGIRVKDIYYHYYPFSTLYKIKNFAMNSKWVVNLAVNVENEKVLDVTTKKL